MKVVVIFATLAVAILGHSSDFSIKLKHDGPTVVGGKINFIARLFEKKEPATGYFKFDWEDNTYGHHTATHESDSPVDVWSVSYPQEDVPLPGKYVTTVTIHKQYHGFYVTVARLQIKFEIKGTKSDKKPHPIVSQSWLDYKRDKILDSQARALNHIQDPRVKSIVSNRIDLINQKIPIISTSYDTPKHEEKREDKSAYLNNIINYKRQRILDSQQRELNHIWNPQVKSLVSKRIDYINSHIPIMQDSFTIPLEKHNKKIDELKEAESTMINSIQEPTVKEAVVGRIKEENKRVPYLSSADDVAARFSDALGAIHERMEEIEESRKQVLSTIEDAVQREEALKKIEEENKWLESKGKELDAQLTEALNNIHRKMVELKEIEAEALGVVDDPVEKQKARVKLDTQNEKVATLLEDVPEEEYPVPLEEMGDKIRELEMAEWEAIESVNDPIVREIILNKLNEHNQEIPTMLKSSDVESKSSKSVSEVHNQIKEDVKKGNDAPLGDIKDPSIKAMVTERIAAKTNKRLEKLKEQDANLTASLTEVRNKIAALKVSEKKIVDGAPDSNKEEVVNLVEEHYQRIPSLLLPSVIETNFTKALDKLNDRMANMTKFMDVATANITNPFVLSMLQAKMALVNYKLVSKYNQIKDNFTALMDKMATETGDESTDTPPSDKNTGKVPKLKLGPGMVLPQLPDIIAQKIAMKSAPFGILTPGATDSVIQNAILDKFAAKNQIMQAKANLIGSNMATAMALIRAKIAALQGLEDSAVEGISDPAVREEVQTSIDEENRKVPILLLPYGIESNFTSALNDFQDRINTIKDSVNVITANITIPAIRSIISSKFDFVNQLLMNKYAQLDSNFTAIMSTIQERFANLTGKPSDETQPDDGPKKVPLLTKTAMGPAPTFDLTKISDLIKDKMAAKSTFATNAMAGIPNPAIQALVTDKINERSKNMSVIADKLAVNFTKIMEAINNKTDELQELESLTLDSIDDPKQQVDVLGQIKEENKKIPSLSLSKRSSSGKKDEVKPVPSKPSMFKLKYPLIARF